MLSGSEIALAGLAALVAGFINSLAGGGTLISFPALVALGIPEVAANVTNTVALCPGYLGGAIAQREELRGRKGACGFYSRQESSGALPGACCSCT